MAPTYNEIPNAITSTKGSITIPATITGVILETAALDFAAANSAVMYDNLYRSEISLTELGPGHWRADVAYGPYKNKEPEDGDFRWEFDTTGGTKHITHGIGPATSYVADGVAFDHKGVIGVNENGDVEGVDIIDHNFRWQEHRELLLSSYSWTYSDTLDELTGKINNAGFRGKAVKTVLFEGATGTWSTDDPTLLQVTYNFAHSRAVVDLQVGDIGGIAKEGWEYLWTKTETVKDAAAKGLGPIPKQVDINKVYEDADFSTLGIGTA